MAGKKNINNIRDLNDALMGFMVEITKVGASSKSDVFDETVRQKLRDYLVGAKYIAAEQWSDKEGIFHEHYRVSLGYKFDFTHLPQIVDNGKPLNLLIVDKPNGSQKWPDLLVIYNGIGLPLEVKSSKDDKIVWNSGLPRPNGLYIFNCYGRSKTTCFLGQHAITEDEIVLLQNRSKEASKINGAVSDRWSFYVRDMNISSENFFENENNIFSANKKEQEVGEKQIKIKMKLSKSDLSDNEKAQIQAWNDRIGELQVESFELHKKYEDDRAKRLEAHSDVLDYLDKLSWDCSQTTDFRLHYDDHDNNIVPIGVALKKRV